ncbi:MAG TPA: cupin domain-containing protein [Solirubrobacteraceae bacterium]|nr:cupin domain-containing protein [Solirubrobacteraceae bacterium]
MLETLMTASQDLADQDLAAIYELDGPANAYIGDSWLTVGRLALPSPRRSAPSALMSFIRSACDNQEVRDVDDKIDLAEKFALLRGVYEPGIVGYLNDYKLQVVKVRGSFVWHKHDETDDFFLVVHGRLTIHLRDRDVELDAGQLFVVPRGVEHCPDAQEEAHVLLIEPKGTVNTGDAGGSLMAEPLEL